MESRRGKGYIRSFTVHVSLLAPDLYKCSNPARLYGGSKPQGPGSLPCSSAPVVSACHVGCAASVMSFEAKLSSKLIHNPLLCLC